MPLCWLEQATCKDVQFMERLSSCPHGDSLAEPQTAQKLVFINSHAVAYRLRENVDFWPGDRSPDGVVIGEYEGRTWVCFVEMKTSSQSTPSAHAWRQLEMGVTHFAPSVPCNGLRTHGDSHHDRWARGRDALEVQPDEAHCVAAVKVLWRHGSRPRPKIKQVCGKKVRFVVVGLSLKGKLQREITFEEFCRKATLPTSGC